MINILMSEAECRSYIVFLESTLRSLPQNSLTFIRLNELLIKLKDANKETAS